MQPDIQGQAQEHQAQGEIGQLIHPHLLAFRCDDVSKEHQDKTQHPHADQQPRLPDAQAHPPGFRMYGHVFRCSGFVFFVQAQTGIQHIGAVQNHDDHDDHLKNRIGHVETPLFSITGIIQHPSGAVLQFPYA